MTPPDCKTRAQCREQIAGFEQRIRDLDGAREFRIDGDYCIGGPTEPYFLPEDKAMALLRSELRHTAGNVDALSWDQLKAKGHRGEGHKRYQFDVTREGCHQSTLYVSVVED